MELFVFGEAVLGIAVFKLLHFLFWVSALRALSFGCTDKYDAIPFLFLGFGAGLGPFVLLAKKVPDHTRIHLLLPLGFILVFLAEILLVEVFNVLVVFVGIFAIFLRVN